MGIGRGRGQFSNARVASSSRAQARKQQHAVYLEAVVNGQLHACLLDSGSEVSILPSFVVESSQIRPANRTLMAANGTSIPVLGVVKVPISTGTFRANLTALVSEHVEECMLGVDFLAENDGSCNFHRATILLAGQPHTLITRAKKKNWCRRVIVQEDVEVPLEFEVVITDR